jgi:hypothetical protein
MSILSAFTSIADLSDYGPATATSTAANLATNVSEGIAILSTTAFRHRFPKTADFWLSFYLIKSGIGGNTYSQMTFYDTAFSTSQPIFRLQQTTSSSNSFKGQMWSGSAWVDVSTESFGMPSSILTRLDFHIKIADTGGVYDVWCAGAKVITGTITDTLITGVTGINMAEFAGYATSAVYSSLIIADEDTRAMFMAQRLPTGNGANTAWTGAYTDVDETGYTDTDFIAATASGQKESYTHAALPAEWATGFAVQAVVISGRMMDGQGSGLFTHGLMRVGGVDYDVGLMGAAILHQGCQKVISLDPSTSAAWSLTNAAAEFGVLASTS